MQKVRMIAQGRVQGVGFRWGVVTLALEIGGNQSLQDGTCKFLFSIVEGSKHLVTNQIIQIRIAMSDDRRALPKGSFHP